MPRLALGAWTAHTLETGFLWLDGGSMFGSVPKALWNRTNPADEKNRIRLAMRCLLLAGEGRRILVDDGVGDKFTPRFGEIYRIELEPHTLERSLESLGLAPDDITDVVLTHLHFDHAAGRTRRSGARLVPRRPRARYSVQRRTSENACMCLERDRETALAGPATGGDDFRWREEVAAGTAPVAARPAGSVTPS